MMTTITGPLFMSCPALSHIQWRLTAEGRTTRLTVHHRAMGQITAEHREGVGKGWAMILGRVRERAEGRGTTSGQRAARNG